MFVKSSEFKGDINFSDNTLILPGGGSASIMACDLLVVNKGYQKVGFFNSKNILATIGSNPLSDGESTQVSLSCEVWQAKTNTILLIRSGVINEKKLKEELLDWHKSAGFRRLFILTTTTNPVRKLRLSNTQIPVIYYYSHNVESSETETYEKQGLAKWAHWLEPEQRTYEHVELDELEGAGHGGDIMERLLKDDISVTLFTIFAQPGPDPLGAYAVYEFLINHEEGTVAAIMAKLDKLSIVAPLPREALNGVETLNGLFSEGSKTQIPQYWKEFEMN